MADITLPGDFPLANGDNALGSVLYTAFYDPSAPTASLSVLNGHMSGSNRAADFELEQIHTQRGSIVTASSSSSNANVDYKNSVFGGFEFGSTDPVFFPALAGQRKIYIPGGNVTTYLPFESNIIVVMFTVYWNAQAPDEDAMSSIYLHIDGEPVQDMARNVMNTSPLIAAEIPNYSTNYGFAKARAFHGHFVTDPSGGGVSGLLSEGWHTIGLGIAADKTVRMTRVHARDIVVMAFKSFGS